MHRATEKIRWSKICFGIVELDKGKQSYLMYTLLSLWKVIESYAALKSIKLLWIIRPQRIIGKQRILFLRTLKWKVCKSLLVCIAKVPSILHVHMRVSSMPHVQIKVPTISHVQTTVISIPPMHITVPSSCFMFL